MVIARLNSLRIHRFLGVMRFRTRIAKFKNETLIIFFHFPSVFAMTFVLTPPIMWVIAMKSVPLVENVFDKISQKICKEDYAAQMSFQQHFRKIVECIFAEKWKEERHKQNRLRTIECDTSLPINLTK